MKIFTVFSGVLCAAFVVARKFPGHLYVNSYSTEKSQNIHTVLDVKEYNVNMVEALHRPQNKFRKEMGTHEKESIRNAPLFLLVTWSGDNNSKCNSSQQQLWGRYQ